MNKHSEYQSFQFNRIAEIENAITALKINSFKKAILPAATLTFASYCSSLPAVQALGTGKFIMATGAVATGFSIVNAVLQAKYNLEEIELKKALLQQAKSKLEYIGNRTAQSVNEETQSYSFHK